MAAGGTTHEKAVAEEKLRRLESKYDFAAKDPSHAEDAENIFSGWPPPRASAKAYTVLKVESHRMDMANLIKWIFQNKFRISSSWKHLPKGAVLMLDASEADVKALKPFTKDLLTTIVAACTEFSRGNHIRELDRAPFLSGIYDGLMNEQRPVGTAMPGYSPVAKKKPARTKKTERAQPAASGATIHPYDIGVDAGKKLRINIPREQLCETIRLAVSGC